MVVRFAIEPDAMVESSGDPAAGHESSTQKANCIVGTVWYFG